jgi:hypothetical protein
MRIVAGKGEKLNSFTAVSFSLVRKYCVIELYAMEILNGIFDV